MTDIEIPYEHERGRLYRFLEMLPAILSYSVLSIPVILALTNPTLAAYFVIGFVLTWFVKALAMSWRVTQGYRRLKQSEALNWPQLVSELDNAETVLATRTAPNSKIERTHQLNMQRYVESKQPKFKSYDLTHAVLIAAYNESIDVIEPTIQSVIDTDFDTNKQVILYLAYEERGGDDIDATAKTLLKRYKKYFKDMQIVKHPKDIPGEVKGKGGNITYAARVLEKELEKDGVDFDSVILTTLDSDNRPHPNYFAALSYAYLVSDKRRNKSFQPVPMFLNNIWDAPAPMRIIATGNSFWQVVQSVRPHLLRNFSAHAQSMAALRDTDYWSVRTIVEDGHQFWRSYFAFDGEHDVVPLYLPIYQDAVLASGYMRTVKAQFIQLRRWAWGASDIAYVTYKGFFTPNKVPKGDLFLRLMRLVEGHVMWASASLILAFSAWLPLLLNGESADNVVAHQLPGLIGTLQQFAAVGIIITMFLALHSLPKRPARYGRRRSVLMVLQWVLLPITTIVYNTLAAVYSQTRLFFGRYLGEFDVTEKAVKK